jgi:hypothetical protein
LTFSSPDCYFSVVDIESAYRWVPIYPAHRELQGFAWKFEGEEQSSYYSDNFLSFGIKIAPNLFDQISQAIVRIMRRAGYKCVSYLDDTLLIGSTKQECAAAQSFLINVLRRLGFSVNWKKVVNPTQRIKFLGLIIDSHLQRVELPQDKLDRVCELASLYIEKRKVTKRELQVLVGHLTFAAKAIRGAKPFTRLFIDAMNNLEQPHHRLRLTSLHKAELLWWKNFAKDFNGLCPCIMGRRRSEIYIRTDASFTGFGAVYRESWLAGAFIHLFYGWGVVQ